MTKHAPPYEMFATLAQDPDENPIVSVIAKRTYQIQPDNSLRYADEQLPLVMEEQYETKDDRPCDVPLAELDTWPYKAATDIVVTGTAYADGGRAVSEMMTGVNVGAYGKVVKIIGDRRVDTSMGGSIRFTSPEPFTEMELSYWRSYGGIDMALTREEPEDLLGLMISLTPEQKPGAYPRNPSGAGYVVAEEQRTLQSLRLPNLEDPQNLLTPQRLIVRDPAMWWTMPMPQGYSWFHSTWYPRSTFGGVIPVSPPPDETDDVEEVRKGYIPKGRCRFLKNAPLEQWVDMRIANGASPGLVVPYLKGNEPVRLVGFSPEGEIGFALPGEKPHVDIRFEKKNLKPKLYLHTLLIEPNEKRLSVVWCARAKTPRVLPDRMPTNDDPMYDMLEGFRIRVDDVKLPHEREPFQPFNPF